MRKERLVVPNEYEYKRTIWEVYYLMMGHYVWHLECECRNFETAYRTAQRLERECDCYTEIRKTEKTVHVWSYWQEY